MSYIPNIELRKAIIERFNEDKSKKHIVSGYVSKNYEPPYAILTNIDKTTNSNKLNSGYDCIVNFDIYSNQNTWLEIELIEEYIISKITLSDFNEEYRKLILNGFVVLRSYLLSSNQTINDVDYRECNLQIVFEIRKC